MPLKTSSACGACFAQRPVIQRLTAAPCLYAVADDCSNGGKGPADAALTAPYCLRPIKQCRGGRRCGQQSIVPGPDSRQPWLATASCRHASAGHPGSQHRCCSCHCTVGAFDHGKISLFIVLSPNLTVSGCPHVSLHLARHGEYQES